MRLSALYGACFAGIGVYMPFFPIWLETRALDTSTIGIILSLPILMRVLVTAPLMSRVDRGLGAGPVLIAGSICLVLVYTILFFAHDPYAIAALVIVMAIAQAPLTPLCDLVTTDAVRNEPRLDYGRIRLWGSITFLIANVAGGYLIGATTPDAAIILLGALALATFGIVPLAVPRAPRSEATGATVLPTASYRLPRSLWLIIAAAASVQASHAAVYAFGSLHWREQGFSDPTIGYLWAVGVVAEILLFGAGGRIVGRPSSGIALLVIGAGAGIVRFALMASSPGLLVTFALQALHGLSFGATHLSAMAALSHLSPPGARGRAQGTLSASMALAMAAGTVLSGFVFRAAEAWVFAAMVPLAALGLVLALLAGRALMAQPHRADEGG